MAGRKKTRGAMMALLLVAVLFSPLPAHSGDMIEESGVALGTTVGNLVYVPVKVATMTLAVPEGLFSWFLSAGNDDLSKQIWHDNLEGPYLITPEMARRSIGERPELKGR